MEKTITSKDVESATIILKLKNKKGYLITETNNSILLNTMSALCRYKAITDLSIDDYTIREIIEKKEEIE